MKKVLPLLLALVCLAACRKAPEVAPSPTAEATPTPTEEGKELWGFPIDDTHDAFEVPTGGKLGTVLVTVEQGEENDGEFGGYYYTLSVWDKSDLETPIQTFEELEPIFNRSGLTDANFDGYTDFLYMWDRVSINWPVSLYVWDERQGQFIFEKTFVGRGVGVDEETKTIHNYLHGSNVSGTSEIYRWEDGELVCVREIEMCYPNSWDDGKTEQDLVVRDRIDGELVGVCRKTIVWTDEDNRIFEEEAKWFDLDYHGEDD